MEDSKLKQDILEAMNVFDDVSLPNFDLYSLNSGYAHRWNSWAKFIDCVSIHEKQKNVVMVLNQAGALGSFSTQDFQKLIFTPARIAFLKQKGYDNINLKGAEENTIKVEQSSNPKRCLTIILRPAFSPNDIKQLQLSSDRLLATGDNTAVEAWCARCKLYLYEDVANGGCKWRFLQQQVDLAKTISPNLSRLLALFGGDRRLPNRIDLLSKDFSAETLAEIELILDDPNIEKETFKFCKTIVEKFSFEEVLKAALKRCAWQYYLPELVKLESETLDEEFRTGLIEYIQNPEIANKTLRVTTLSELEKKIKLAVQKKLGFSSKVSQAGMHGVFSPTNKPGEGKYVLEKQEISRNQRSI